MRVSLRDDVCVCERSERCECAWFEKKYFLLLAIMKEVSRRHKWRQNHIDFEDELNLKITSKNDEKRERRLKTR